MVDVNRKPAEVNLNVVEGDDFIQAFRFKNKETLEEIDMDGWTGLAQIRLSQPPDPVLATFAIEDFDFATAPGLVVISLTDTETEALNVGSYRWDLELTDTTGFTRTWLQGNFVVLPQVTKAP